jgi:hypothetical protein
MSRYLAAILVILAVTLPVAAAETRFDPESLAKTVAPYLDDRTLLVAHVDTARLEAKTIVRALVQLFGSEERDFEPVQKRLEVLLPGFRNAGGRDLFVVLSLMDLNEGPFFIVPMKEEGKALTALLRGVMRQPNQATMKLGDAIVAGPKTTLVRLQKLKATARPELAKALAAAGDGAAQVCLLPPDALRRALEEMLPQLPEDLGSISMKELTRNSQWAAVNVEIAPSVQLRLTMQAADGESAKTLHGALVRLLTSLAKHEQIRALVPNVEKAIPLATPKVSGDRLILTREEKELATLSRPILAPFAPSPRSDTTIRLHQILLALLNYEAAHRQFPAAANYDRQGKPLLSWRVHILPFLGEEQLYKEFHLDEPWNSEHNKKLISRMPAVFRSSENAAFAKDGKTTFLAPLGNATMFPDKRGVRIGEITDGTSNTIFLVDVEDARAVVWTQPEDWRYDPGDPLKGLMRRLRDRYMVGMADSSVRLLQKDISKYTMQALLTRGGGEVVGPDF